MRCISQARAAASSAGCARNASWHTASHVGASRCTSGGTRSQLRSSAGHASRVRSASQPGNSLHGASCQRAPGCSDSGGSVAVVAVARSGVGAWPPGPPQPASASSMSSMHGITR
jgi:hypothetical protein